MTGQTKNFRSKKHDGSANPIDIYVGRRTRPSNFQRLESNSAGIFTGNHFSTNPKIRKRPQPHLRQPALVYGTADGRIGRLLFQRNQRRTMERKFQTAAAVMEKTRFNRVIFMYEWLS